MAHIWKHAGFGGWAAISVVPTTSGLDIGLPGLELHCAAGSWVLLSGNGADVRVNGETVALGVRALADRDEIRSGGVTVYFSTETLANVEAFPGADRVLYCPRCKQPIERGTQAVRCPGPGCGCWHHQSGDLPCWTYSSTCALCPQPTSLDAGFQWTPEEV